MKTLLNVTGLRAGYNRTEIVHGIDFSIDEGELVCILGPNGCGKSTTLKTILGLLPILSGTVELAGKDARRLSESERAKISAYIPQAHTPPFPFTVADVVMLGRTPYLNSLAVVTMQDSAAVQYAMERMGILAFADMPYTELSGGQQQLVLIARALAQEPRLMVMDEPTANLDFGNQQLVLRQMRGLADDGMAVLMVTHDPDHALFCADRVLVMEAGRVIANGIPSAVLDRDCLERIYHTHVQVMDINMGNRLQRVCIPVLDASSRQDAPFARMPR